MRRKARHKLKIEKTRNVRYVWQIKSIHLFYHAIIFACVLAARRISKHTITLDVRCAEEISRLSLKWRRKLKSNQNLLKSESNEQFSNKIQRDWERNIFQFLIDEWNIITPQIIQLLKWQVTLYLVNKKPK